MAIDKIDVSRLTDSAQLANRLFYDYLKFLRPHLKTLQLQLGYNFDQFLEAYNPAYPYGNRYRDLLLKLQDIVTKRPVRTDRSALNLLLIAIYENDNAALKTTAQWITTHAPTSRAEIKTAAKPKTKGPNFTNPSAAENTLAKLNALIGSWFQPMLAGSIPTVRKYETSTKTSTFTELRFGTQIEVVAGRIRINPLFEAYLAAKAAQLQLSESQTKTTHLYFNSLRRGGGAIERVREGRFTLALKRLVKRHPNLAVVTLPADGGLLDHHHIYDTKTGLTKDLVIQEISQAVLNKRGLDFKISLTVQKAIQLNQAKVNELLTKSLEALGLDKQTTISPAQRHALMFHFVKFELTAFIIAGLNPDAVNFSCKDAIDRGGVHSLYYNLLISLQDGYTPLTEAEFKEGLDAAPTYVKGRAMNVHTENIWNAVDQYITAHKADPRFTAGGELAWLVKWRNDNKPKLQSSYKVKTTKNKDGKEYDFLARKKRHHQRAGFNFVAFILNFFARLISFFAVCTEMRNATTKDYQPAAIVPNIAGIGPVCDTSAIDGPSAKTKQKVSPPAAGDSPSLQRKATHR